MVCLTQPRGCGDRNLCRGACRGLAPCISSDFFHQTPSFSILPSSQPSLYLFWGQKARKHWHSSSSTNDKVSTLRLEFVNSHTDTINGFSISSNNRKRYLQSFIPNVIQTHTPCWKINTRHYDNS